MSMKEIKQQQKPWITAEILKSIYTVIKKVVLETNIDESYFGAELTMFPGFY